MIKRDLTDLKIGEKKFVKGGIVNTAISELVILFFISQLYQLLCVMRRL